MNHINLINSFRSLHRTLPLSKVQGLGGKFGEKICEDLGIQHMADLIKFSREELQRRYDERNGHWLYNIARGIDLEAVTPRLVSKSIGCCKKFPGRNAISAITTLNHWLHELAQEITERLEQDGLENNRRPKQMVVSFVQTINNVDVSSSRTVNLTSFDEEKIVNDALDVLKRNTEKFFKSSDNTVLNNAIKFLGFNVGKFESTDAKKGNTIQNMFQRTIENQKIEPKDEENATTINEENCDAKSEESSDAKSEGKSEEDKAKDKKKNDPKESYFAKYHRMQLEKKAEEEAARKAEEERLHNENQSDEAEESDEENIFQNDMLMEELVESNQTLQHQDQTQRPESPAQRSESPAPSTSTKQDYVQTYAEFYIEPKNELPKVECTQCGKKVNAYDIQIHTDEHLAFQLTQEQRVEFQNQLKRNITTASPAAKKPKTNNKPDSKTETSNANVASIQKFLVKPGLYDTSATPSTSTESDVATEKCSECGKNIPITEILEHMDFHAAKKLHDELMKADMTNRTNNNTIQNSAGKNASAGKSKKSKKKTVSSSSGSSSNNAPSAMKNIASFFQNS